MSAETEHRRGKLKIYLGYAAGVGKTCQMLDDGQQLRQKGADVVNGYLECHGRADTISKSEGLELIPRRSIVYRGSTFQEMDTDAILRRRPQICLVDELAHTNVPGSEREKRWQDVRVLLDAGIDVLSTLNVQHLESLNDQVLQLTGVRVRETVPDWVVDEADEIVLVDVTPRALRHRLERGAVYAREKAQKALANFFAEHKLNALREMAMRQTAHEIEERLDEPAAPAASGAAPSVSAEAAEPGGCILICVDERPSSAMLIRRGKRLADYLRADCVAVYIAPDQSWTGLTQAEREAVERHLNFARNMQIETQVLEGPDFARTLVDFAHERHVTQIYMGRRRPKGLAALTGRSKLHRLVRLARDMEIIIVAERLRAS